MPENFPIVDDIARIDSVLDAARSEGKDMNDALANLNQQGAFNNIDNILGVSGRTYKISPNKELQVLSNDGTYKNIDPKKAYNDMIEKGELKSALIDMGADPNNIPPNVDNLANSWKANYKELAGIQAINNVDRITTNGRLISERIGNLQPKDYKNLQEILDKHKSDIGDQFNEQIKRLKNDSGFPNVKIGTFLKYVLVLGGTAFGLAEAYQAVKNHQNNVNGCWLIKIQNEGSSFDSEKCKVKILTCNSNYDVSNNNRQFCYCEAANNPSGPISCNSSIYPTNNCGTGSTDCFAADMCVSYTGPTGSTGCNGTLSELACPSGAPDVSDYCDCSKIQCPEGWILKKVNMDFWAAAADMFGNDWSIAESWITTILKWIAIIIGSLLVLFVLWKFILALIERYSHGGKSKFRGKKK